MLENLLHEWYDPVDFITELELSNITGGDNSKRNEYDIYNYLEG